MTNLQQAGYSPISRADVPNRHLWALDKNTPADANQVCYFIRQGDKATSYGVASFDGAQWREFAVMVRAVSKGNNG